MPSPPSYGCCTRVNFVLKKHLLFQMNLSNSGLKNRSIKEYWLIFTVLKFPLGLQFSHNLTKFKIIKYISTIYIMTTTCTYLQQLTQVSDVAHGPLVIFFFGTCLTATNFCLQTDIQTDRQVQTYIAPYLLGRHGDIIMATFNKTWIKLPQKQRVVVCKKCN